MHWNTNILHDSVVCSNILYSPVHDCFRCNVRYQIFYSGDWRVCDIRYFTVQCAVQCAIFYGGECEILDISRCSVRYQILYSGECTAVQYFTTVTENVSDG